MKAFNGVGDIEDIGVRAGDSGLIRGNGVNGHCAQLKPESIITQSKRMLEIFDFLSSILELDTTILINGETGTGKELLARAIHSKSLRVENPL